MVTTAHMIAAKIDGNRVEPGDEPGFRPEGADVMVDPNECFLGQFLGVRFIPDVPIDEMKQRRLMAGHQLIQRRVVASLECFNEGEIFTHTRLMAAAGFRFESLRREFEQLLVLLGCKHGFHLEDMRNRYHLELALCGVDFLDDGVYPDG